MTRRLMTCAAMITLLVLAPGCGPRTATAAGKVTYQGKPVVWGSVSLRAADGSMHQIGINPDGTYRLDRVPVGPAKVGVSSPDPAPSARLKAAGDDPRVRPGPAPPPGAWFPLPAKFADPASSGVTVQVGGGAADIDLK
ncbi:MAG: hypothetical protein U0797_07095 [Gemmataceae bacterium]